MLAYPNISPVALSLGPVQVHWYGLMYLFAFLAGWGLARWRASRPAWIAAGWNGQKVDDLLTWIMLGVVAGGRLGYVLFYDLPVYLDQPSEIFKIWNGGMSFHGGLIGVLLMGWWWSRRNKKKFMDVVDFVAPLVPPGLFFGRIGNFINGELWGGVTDGPLGMVFPTGGPLPRHPSQLYEAGLEGLVLFVVLWVFVQDPSHRARFRPVRGVVRRVPFCRGVCPPARSPARLSGFRLAHDGAAFVCSFAYRGALAVVQACEIMRHWGGEGEPFWRKVPLPKPLPFPSQDFRVY
jgi:phosphatidylglycerol:prolipoprotein diacylglycerol transferase